MHTYLPLHGEAIRLAPRALLTVDDAAGVHIACSEGDLWVTLDHDPRDIILAAGESFYTTEHRRAVVFALSGAQLTLRREAVGSVEITAPRWSARVLGASRLGTA